MKPTHLAGIHIITCVDKDSVAQVCGYKLHHKFKDAQMVSLMYWIASECSVIIGPHTSCRFACHALSKQLIALTHNGQLPCHMNHKTTLTATSIEHTLSQCP